MEIKDSGGKVVAKVTALQSSGVVTDGVWLTLVSNAKQPTLCLYKEGSNLILGVYKSTTDNPKACDLAFTLGEDGVTLQVTKGDEVKIVNLFDLLNKIS